MRGVWCCWREAREGVGWFARHGEEEARLGFLGEGGAKGIENQLLFKGRGIDG